MSPIEHNQDYRPGWERSISNSNPVPFRSHENKAEEILKRMENRKKKRERQNKNNFSRS